MGLLDLMRLMSIQRQQDQERRRRQAQTHARDRSIASQAERKSPCQTDSDSQGADLEIHSERSLPEDIWRHIHSLMPMRDAARAACVSRSFLCSWRCHPNLDFSKDTLVLNENACHKDESAQLFNIKVDHILKKHSGIGVKKLKIQISPDYSETDCSFLNKWLEKAVTPGIEELTLIIVPFRAKYNFPVSLLLNGSGESIGYLHLAHCSFHPTITLGLRSLTRLHLCLVCITGDELGCLLSHSLALKQLELRSCDKIVCLKVPHLLQRLNYLEVRSCANLKMIDNEAPNVSRFTFSGDSTVQLSLGETSQMKSLTMDRCGSVHYARAELPSIMPNLEALSIHSDTERASVPMLCSKFVHLRHLSIALIGAPFSATYDYLSLASFLDAAPSLETFSLNVWQQNMKNISVFEDPLDLREMREPQHHNLRRVMITGFSSAKSLVELTCHVLKSIISLECLMLEAPQSCIKCSDRHNKSGKCFPLPIDILMEGHRGVMAIRRYIEPSVPSTVKLHVLGPCSCHAAELQMSCLS